MTTDLQKALEKLNVADLAVDGMGRVVIRNSDLSKAIRDAAPSLADDTAGFLDNCECTTNQKCRPDAAAMLNMLRRL